MSKTTLTKLFACGFALVACASASAVSTTSIGFDGGSDGGFAGNAFYEATGGNPDGNAHFLVSAFGISLRTGGLGEPSNADFLGDYSRFASVTFSVDVQVNAITDFLGNDQVREIGIALIDRDIQGADGPSGVYAPLGLLASFLTGDWTTLSLTIDDTSATALPPGWIGFGDTDLTTFEPILPSGATFASVLAGVDEFQLTTFVPGFFFNDSNYDVRVDNLSLTTVPLPAGLVLMLSALGALGLRRIS